MSLAPMFLICFNSLLVRLKEQLIVRRMSEFILFQFLIGAIKSAFQKLRQRCPSMFQFLIGAIKSLHGKGLCAAIASFNSLLVRLKVSAPTKEMESLISFNSLLVRLKAAKRHERNNRNPVSIPYWCD